MPRRKPNGGATLAETQAALATTEQQIAEAAKHRNGALLAGDDAAIDALDGELAKLRTAAGRHRERVKLLETQEAERQNERRVAERASLTERIERTLAPRCDLLAAEFTAGVLQADGAMRKMFQINRQARAAWNFGPADVLACLLYDGAIVSVLRHEIFRIGRRPRLGGGQDRSDGDYVDFPGGQPPELGLIDLPGKVRPLAEVMHEANTHVSTLMRSGKGVPDSALVVSATTSPASVANGGDAGEPQRTPAQIELAKLLEKQSVLAAVSSPTPAQDQEYASIVVEIAKAALAVEAEQGAHHA
jgi:hypothetical protein